MKKPGLKIKILILLIIISNLIVSTTDVLAVSSLFDRMSGGLKNAVNQAYGGGQNVEVKDATFLTGLITIINYLLEFAGIIFFLLLIYAGWLWLDARGRSDQVEKAKKITREVVVGLIIIILARLLTEFILTQVGLATQPLPAN